MVGSLSPVTPQDSCTHRTDSALTIDIFRRCLRALSRYVVSAGTGRRAGRQCRCFLFPILQTRRGASPLGRRSIYRGRVRRKPIELAAVATAAVPGLTPTAVSSAPDDPADFDSALLLDSEGKRWRVRSPRHAEASARLETEFLVLRAFVPGIRAELPFLMPTVAGTVRQGPLSTFVYSHLAGATSVRGGTERPGPPHWPAKSARHWPPSTTCPTRSSAMPTCRATPPTSSASAGSTSSTRPRPPARSRRCCCAAGNTRWRMSRCGGSTRAWSTATSMKTTSWSTATASPPSPAGLTCASGTLPMTWPGWSPRMSRPSWTRCWRSYTASRRDVPDAHLLRRAALSAEFALAQYLVKGVAAGNQEMIREAESMLTCWQRTSPNTADSRSAWNRCPSRRPRPLRSGRPGRRPTRPPSRPPAVSKVTLLPADPVPDRARCPRAVPAGRPRDADRPRGGGRRHHGAQRRRRHSRTGGRAAAGTATGDASCRARPRTTQRLPSQAHAPWSTPAAAPGR